ncbi:hypothetical protein ACJQWK_03846 [Exserohilum turcicum]|uniref:Uncharacterized protein n=1 Tax=Exserohilum turcicum (strain 28A) TaxID=671987 RepID=R0J3A7_EXST2|nr:uncharacterized protein SETTUDRAFT_112808 [Exserohilum turcica Et28A]EOA91206.1 hypothetical protein SETTUDRAFT_112808 [Exserohilum turcica Et28A]
MSTTFISSRRRQSTITFTSSRRRQATSSTTPTSTESSLRTASLPPTAEPPSNLASDLRFAQLKTDAANPSTINGPIQPPPACSTDSACATDKTCHRVGCVAMENAAPFGGSDSTPTSHLTTASAIAVGVGLVATLVLLAGIAFWVCRRRAQRPRNQSLEAAMQNPLSRSASNATDSKTLVASMPNSPQNVAFTYQHAMGPGFFARALVSDETKDTSKLQVSTDNVYGRSGPKALPLLPLPNLPLPPPPKDTTLYALNVSINKSMIMDEDMMQAVSPLRGNDTPRSSIPRERAPRYIFEEYIPPPIQAPPPISIWQAPTSDAQNLEYELSAYPKKSDSDETVLLSGRGSVVASEPSSPLVESFPDIDSSTHRLSLGDLPPPSPSFSFRSYDWYQEIIEDPTQGEPTTPTLSSHRSARASRSSAFPKPLYFSPSKNTKAVDSSLYPEPLSPGAPPAAPGTHLHPNSAAKLSPTSPNFRLSPTVYTPPQRSSLPAEQPPLEAKLSVRASRLSKRGRTPHDSRSWLPEEGLYLADECGLTRYLTFRRGNEEGGRPTSYSPLT